MPTLQSLSASDHDRSLSKRCKSPRSPSLKGSSCSSETAPAGGTNKPVRTIVPSQGSGRFRKTKSNRNVMSGSSHSKTSSSSSSTAAERKRMSRPGTASPFLRKTHRELKDQIAILQEQMAFVQNLACMKEDKQVDLLFKMIDYDGSGRVDASELAAAMRLNQGLSVTDSLQKAIDMVATFDINGDAELDRGEFDQYLQTLVQKLNLSVSEFTEFLIVQLLRAQQQDGANEGDHPEVNTAAAAVREQIKEEVRKRAEFFAVLSNDVLIETFETFAIANDKLVQFKTISKALYYVTQTDNRKIQESLMLLLMSDTKDSRKLDYEQFCRLIVSVSETTGVNVEVICNDVLNAQESLTDLGDTFSSFGEESCGGYINDTGSTAVDALTCSRLQRLFDLWDVNVDGGISVAELSRGLRKFQAASEMTVNPDELAQAFIAFDADGNNLLDPVEFANAMMRFSQHFGVDLHPLIDFMCIATTKSQASRTQRRQKSNDDNNTWEFDPFS